MESQRGAFSSRRESNQNEGATAIPEHLRRPSLPPPTGPLPPTPENANRQSSSRGRMNTPDRLSGRPFLPSSSLPLWSAKRTDATIQHIRVRGSTIMSPTSGNKMYAGRSGHGSPESQRPSAAEYSKGHDQESGSRSKERRGPVSPSYPSSATLQDSIISSSASSSSNNIPIPLPRFPSARFTPDGAEKSKSACSSTTKSSTSSSSSSSSSHHRSLSQPIPALTSSIRKLFHSDARRLSDLENVPESAAMTTNTGGNAHQRAASSAGPQSQPFWSMSSSEEEAVMDAKLTGEPVHPRQVANFSRKPVFTDRFGNPATTSSLPRQHGALTSVSSTTRKLSNTQSAQGTTGRASTSPPVPSTTGPLQTANSPNSNRTGSSSILSAAEFGYFPFLTESNSPRNSAQNGSHRGSQSSSRGRVSAGISTDDIVRDLRSLSRLSGLSHVSGGAAFIISEDGDSSDRLGRLSQDVEDNNPYSRIGLVPTVKEYSEYPGDADKGDSIDSGTDKGKKAVFSSSEKMDEDESGIGKMDSNDSSFSENKENRQSSSSNESSQKELVGGGGNIGFRQLTPSNLRIHPADQRYSHTYRIRQSAGEDPVLIPVYNFPAPGAFPNRNHLTFPTPNPTASKHTKGADSVEMYDGGAPSNNSSERLIPEEHGHVYKHHRNYSQFDGASGGPSQGREKYLGSGTFALVSTTAGPKGQITGSPGGTGRQETGSSIADTSDIGAPDIVINDSEPMRMTARDLFEREHASQFTPTTHPTMEPKQPEARRKNEDLTVLPHQRIAPHLFRPDNTYVGDEIDQERWPDRYSRQQKIGRYLLIMCTIMPPLWIILAAGGLDIFVNELTDGEIWTVGKREKLIAAWLGGSFFTGLLITVITVGVLVL